MRNLGRPHPRLLVAQQTPLPFSSMKKFASGIEVNAAIGRLIYTSTFFNYKIERKENETPWELG